MNSTFTLGIIGGTITLVVLFEMLRRQRLREKYAVIWVVVVGATLTLVVFPDLLSWAAGLLGVQVPANLLFFGALMLLLVISIQFSYEIGRLEERTRTLPRKSLCFDSNRTTSAVVRLRLFQKSTWSMSATLPPKLRPLSPRRSRRTANNRCGSIDRSSRSPRTPMRSVPDTLNDR